MDFYLCSKKIFSFGILYDMSVISQQFWYLDVKVYDSVLKLIYLKNLNYELNEIKLELFHFRNVYGRVYA